MEQSRNFSNTGVGPTTATTARASRAPGGLVGPLTLSYVAGAALLAALLYAGGIWNVIANTRVLDLMVRGGIVALTDADSGYIKGVPDLKYYLASQDAIDWGMVLLAVGVFLTFWAIKAVQFRDLARFCGIEGTTGQLARAYFYGQGVNRLLPFNIGNIAAAAALEGQGATLGQGARVVFLGEMSTVMEIAVFAAFGLVLVPWTTWLSVMIWAFVILGTAWLLVRPGGFRLRRRERGVTEEGHGFFKTARAILPVLASQPAALTRVVVLGLLAFGLEDIAAFAIAQAFTSKHVILHADAWLILMAVVASYVARFIPVTPGGIGQFEWGFAAALYLGGVGLPEAVTIAILDNVVRYVTGTAVLGGLSLGYGIETNLRRVLDIFRSPPDKAPELVA